MAIVVTGVAGVLQWGYHEAATIGTWRRAGLTLTGTVVSVDPFRVTQRPLTFVVLKGGAAWRWPVQDLQVDGVSLTATLVENGVVSHGTTSTPPGRHRPPPL